MFLAAEVNRRDAIELMKQLQDAKQLNYTNQQQVIGYVNGIPSKSMKEIHSLNLNNNEKIWVKFDDVSRKRAHSAPHDGNSDDSDTDDNENDDQYQPLNHNYLQNLERKHSLKSAPTPTLDNTNLPAIDEQKEESIVKPDDERGHDPQFIRQLSNGTTKSFYSVQSDVTDLHEQPQYIHRSSIHSDSTYNEEEDESYGGGDNNNNNNNNGPSYKVYSDGVSSPKQQGSFISGYGYQQQQNGINNNNNGLPFMYNKTSSTGTAISPLTSIGGHSRYDSFDINGVAVNGQFIKSIYIDNDGIDVTDNVQNKNEKGNDEIKDVAKLYKLKMDQLTKEHQHERVTMIKQFNELKGKLNQIQKSQLQQENNNNDNNRPQLGNNISLLSQESKSDTISFNIQNDSNSVQNGLDEIKSGEDKQLLIKKIRQNSWPLSDSEPIDLRRTQKMNEKMQMVSLENAGLKLKNEKLRKEIRDLIKQLSINNNNHSQT